MPQTSNFVTQKRKIKVKLYFTLGCIFLCFILSAAAVSRLSIFKIKDVKFYGIKEASKDIIADELRSRALSSAAGKFLGAENLFSWPSGDIYLNNKFIAQVSLQKDWLNRTISVSVDERKRYLIWCEGESCAWVDKSGIALEEGPSSDGQLVYTIHSTSGNLIVLGEKILDEPRFTYLVSILDTLKKNNIGTQKISFNHKTQDLEALSVQGSILLFSLKFDPAFTAQALEIIKSKLGPRLEYADFRIENKVFYRENYHENYGL